VLVRVDVAEKVGKTPAWKRALPSSSKEVKGAVAGTRSSCGSAAHGVVAMLPIAASNRSQRIWISTKRKEQVVKAAHGGGLVRLNGLNASLYGGIGGGQLPPGVVRGSPKAR
jgi:hypothetical protein